MSAVELAQYAWVFGFVALGIDVLVYAHAPVALRWLAVIPAGVTRSTVLPTRVCRGGATAYRAVLREVVTPRLPKGELQGASSRITSRGGSVGAEPRRLGWVAQDLLRPALGLHLACLSVVRVDGRVEGERLRLEGRFSPPWPTTLLATSALLSLLVSPLVGVLGGLLASALLLAAQRRLCAARAVEALDDLAARIAGA